MRARPSRLPQVPALPVPAWRARTIALLVAAAFLGIALQLVRLAARGGAEPAINISEPIAGSFARPDILDRHGRLIATDVGTHSLYVDPALVLDRDEVAERLKAILPDLDEADLLRNLQDRSRRFLWIRRSLSPRTAQTIHDLGLPGLAFRDELKRAYPVGTLAGHVLGSVNIDNRGQAGIERYIDEHVGIDAVHGATRSDRPAVRLSLDLGAQAGLEDELRGAVRRYSAKAASGVVMDVGTGEIVAYASLPDVDPSRPLTSLTPDRFDHVAGGTFELGSILKLATVAMALDPGETSLDTVLDTDTPLASGRFTIRDLHPAGHKLSVREVFLKSSNIGAALLALRAGPERQRAFLGNLGLLGPIATEAGAVASPQLPEHWERTATITIAYGHGLALAPLQLVAATAALVNGGTKVHPTLLARRASSDPPPAPTRVITPETSAQLRLLMRLNVTDPGGTGRRADAAGYEVGGKTGTADIAGKGAYRKGAVIASFLAAFPMSRPRYVVLVSLFEPQPVAETQGQVLAALNATPTVGRIIARLGPLLGVAPASAPRNPNPLISDNIDQPPAHASASAPAPTAP